MEKMKFGIVISTFRREDGKTPFYLNRTLDSLLNQSYQNFKVFLIGDRYEDFDEFNSYGTKFSLDKIYKENLLFAEERDQYDNSKIIWMYGGCNAFNYGVDLAIKDGIDYIIKLDHDDWFESNHLQNFKECIDTTNADFMCSKSTHVHGVLPTLDGDKKFIKFLPAPAGLVKSSHCMNYKTIPLRSRNVYKETGIHWESGDVDLWKRVNTHIKENNLKSYMVNEITCHHDEEGYVKRGGR